MFNTKMNAFSSSTFGTVLMIATILNTSLLVSQYYPALSASMLKPTEQSEQVNKSRGVSEVRHNLTRRQLVDRVPDSREYGKYLPNYKNPCWFDGSPSAENLRCLPYFYMLGTGKSGSTSLCLSLNHHPDIALPSQKEIGFWDQVPRSDDDVAENYTTYFKEASFQMFKSTLHEKITYDCTPRNFWKNMLPEQLVRTNKDTRFIIIMRQPTERLFSRYHHTCLEKNLSCSPEQFHQTAQAGVDQFTECRLIFSTTECCRKTFDDWHVSSSVYVGYVEDWIRTFPASQFLFVRSKDFYENSRGVLDEVFNFLDLGAPDETTYDEMSEHVHVTPAIEFDVNGTWNSYKGGLLPETKTLLDNFYSPYNQMLADLLHDRRFLFDD